MYENSRQPFRVRVLGNRIYFMSVQNGAFVVKEISEVLTHMTETKTSDKKKEEMLVKIEKMQELIKDMKDESECSDYVISELESIGMKLRRIERRGYRPINIDSKGR